MMFKGTFSIVIAHCVEMGVKAVEMDLEDGKLQINIRLLSIEKSRDESFTYGKGNISVYVFLINMFKETFSIVIALRWV